jgi:hypothetical protein
MFATFKRCILDNEELLKEATDIYHNGNLAEEDNFYQSLSDDELKQVRKHIHIISLYEKIAHYRGEKTGPENVKPKLSTFYDAVFELLKLGEQIDNDVLIDLLKQIGIPKNSKTQQEQMKSDQSTKITDIPAAEVDILTKALYSWPTKKL